MYFGTRFDLNPTYFYAPKGFACNNPDYYDYSSRFNTKRPQSLEPNLVVKNIIFSAKSDLKICKNFS
jgi:hypothetical protein